DRLDRIGRHAAAEGKHLREPVLRDRAALARGTLQQRGGGGLVLGDAGPVEQRDGVFNLRIGVVGGRRGGAPARRRAYIPGNAAALLVKRAERVLCLRTAPFRRGAEQLGSTRKVLREQLALEIEQREIVSCSDMSELSGGGKQAGGFFAIDR